ncbi:lasso peptide biosynthesis B2 protein [Brevundimonas sp. NPDC046655]|jgi:hypothetical protein|uniref:lasso peptide biosynthesis B2 protein n=1 Tax=unclassified Brevundimonas TaxID=2622653 RepID=UPI0038508BF3
MRTRLQDDGAADRQAQLAPGIHAVRAGRDLILLDLAADDYLCLPECGPLKISGAVVRGPMETLLRLAAEELLHSERTPAPHREVPPALPRTALTLPDTVRPTFRDLATFSVIWLDAARVCPTLYDLARRVQGRCGRQDDLAAIAARVEVFNRLLPLVPWTGACLLQAELLLRFLNAAGLDADWVFGVRTWPFLAHCWLQVGDVCVSQVPETLTIYRPIMVI